MVSAAAKAFGERGYNGASMRQIAADVGVSPAALLRHFQDKEELLAAVLEWWARETAALRLEGRDGLGAFDGLRDLMTYHTHHRGLLELFIHLTGEASSEKHPARAFSQDRYTGIVNMLVKRLLATAETGEIPPLTDAQAEVRALCATMDGLEIQWLLDPTVDLAGLFDFHLDHTLARWRSGGYAPVGGS
ncbi:TetR/AcrR family transcriptional regulator [Nonomuraea jabiensis]|nr:TetR/AcrR family transcriptional regulator [Nonomuraea jabiensis]